MSNRRNILSEINYKKVFLNNLGFLFVFGVAVLFSLLAGSRVNPPWLGYGVGFVIAFFAFGVINQLIKLIGFRGDSKIISIHFVQFIIYFTSCAALSTVLAAQWRLADSPLTETAIWTTVETVSKITAGAIAGTVSVIALGIIILVINAFVGEDTISWAMIGFWAMIGKWLHRDWLRGIWNGGIVFCAIVGMIGGATSTGLILGSNQGIIGLGALGGMIGGAAMGIVLGFFAMICMKMAID